MPRDNHKSINRRNKTFNYIKESNTNVTLKILSLLNMQCSLLATWSMDVSELKIAYLTALTLCVRTI